MSLGEFRHHFPRITLYLPGATRAVPVEFVIDTGFEGELAVPASTLRRLDAQLVGRELFALADEAQIERQVYELLLNWNDEQRLVQVLGLEGNPLLGTLLLEGNQLRVDAEEGGEVVIEPL